MNDYVPDRERGYQHEQRLPPHNLNALQLSEGPNLELLDERPARRGWAFLVTRPGNVRVGVNDPILALYTRATAIQGRSFSGASMSCSPRPIWVPSLERRPRPVEEISSVEMWC